MRFLKALWLAVFFFLTLLFFIQNNDALVHKLSLKMDFYYFNYVWTNTAVPYYFVILVGFLAGCVVTVGYLFMERLHIKMDLRRSRRQVRAMEGEIKKLREIPMHAATPLIEVGTNSDAQK